MISDFFCRLYSIICYYKILGIISCAPHISIYSLEGVCVCVCVCVFLMAGYLWGEKKSGG